MLLFKSGCTYEKFLWIISVHLMFFCQWLQNALAYSNISTNILYCVYTWYLKNKKYINLQCYLHITFTVHYLLLSKYNANISQSANLTIFNEKIVLIYCNLWMHKILSNLSVFISRFVCVFFHLLFFQCLQRHYLTQT